MSSAILDGGEHLYPQRYGIHLVYSLSSQKTQGIQLSGCWCQLCHVYAASKTTTSTHSTLVLMVGMVSVDCSFGLCYLLSGPPHLLWVLSVTSFWMVLAYQFPRADLFAFRTNTSSQYIMNLLLHLSGLVRLHMVGDWCAFNTFVWFINWDGPRWQSA